MLINKRNLLLMELQVEAKSEGLNINKYGCNDRSIVPLQEGQWSRCIKHMNVNLSDRQTEKEGSMNSESVT